MSAINSVWVRRPWDAGFWMWGGYVSVIEAQDDYERTVEAHPEWEVRFVPAVPTDPDPFASFVPPAGRGAPGPYRKKAP